MKKLLIVLSIILFCSTAIAGEEEILDILEHMKTGATIPTSDFSQLEGDLNYEREMYKRSDNYDYLFDLKAMSTGWAYSDANLYWNSSLFDYPDYKEKKEEGDTKLNELYDIYDEIQDRNSPSASPSSSSGGSDSFCFISSIYFD